MNRNPHPFSSAAALAAGVALAATLAACGGGDSGSTAAPAATPLALTSANRDAVATEVAAQLVAVSSDTNTGSGILAARPGSAASGFSNARVPGIAAKALQTVIANPPRKRALAVTTSDYGCTTGTGVVEFNDRDNNGRASVGDVFTIQLANCVIGAERLSGTLALTITQVVVTATTITVSSTFVTTALTTVVGTEQVVLDGSATLDLTYDTQVNPVALLSATLVAGSTGVRTVFSGVVLNAAVDHLAGFTEDLTASATEETWAVAGTVRTGDLTRYYVLSTPAPVVILNADTRPSSGQLLVTGAFNSRLRLTILSSTSVLVELDANGDGIYEFAETRLWTDLV